VRLMPLLGRDPRRHGQNQDVDLVSIASWHVPTTARIKVGDYLEVKDRAIACHASQRPLAETKNKLLRGLMRQLESRECFSRVYPPVVRGEAVETNLLALGRELSSTQVTETLSVGLLDKPVRGDRRRAA
jgi:LmbE family N-acetylglucosaminyl deacetylase